MSQPDLLRGLGSSDNAVRGAAEHQLQQWRERDLGGLSAHLLAAARATSAAPELCSLSAIVLRRVVVDSPSGYELLGEGVQAALRAELLAALLQGDMDGKTKVHICDIVGKLAATTVECNEWPEVLPAANQLLQSQHPSECEVGFTLLEWLVQGASYLEVLVGGSNIDALAQTLRRGLQAGTHATLMLAAMRATSCLLSRTRSEAHVDALQPAVADVAAGLQSLLAAGPAAEGTVRDFLACMIDIAAEKPTFFGGAQLAPTLALALHLMHSPATSSDARSQLIELVVTLCEYLPREVKRLKGPGGEAGFVVVSFLPLLAMLMAGIPDIAGAMAPAEGDDGADCDDDDIGDGSSIDPLVGTAENAYDRVCGALGLRATFPAVMEQLRACFGGDAATSRWQHRYAGILILANYLDLSAGLGKKDQAEYVGHLDLVVRQLAHFAADPVPRVRLAAFFGITQLLVSHGSRLSQEQLGGLLDVVVSGVGAAVNPSPRVRRHALGALVNILELLPESMMAQRAADVLAQTVAAMSAGPLVVQERCVSVVISLSQTVSPAHVAALYDAVAPILQQLMTYAQGAGLSALWGQALHCLAVVGQAAGKDKFRHDALSLMRSLVGMHEAMAPEAEAQAYMLQAWVRIAPCLEADFLPFLPLVVGRIVQALSTDITAGTGDVDLDDPELGDRPDIEVLDTLDGYLVVRTSAAEDQATACQLVRLLVEGVGASFLPFVETTAQALLPLVQSPHEDVRCEALAAMPALVRTVAQAPGGRDALGVFFGLVLARVVQQTLSESQPEFTMNNLQVLSKIVYHATYDWSRPQASEGGAEGEGEEEPQASPATSLPILSTEQMLELSRCCMGALRDSIQGRALLRAQLQLGDRDEDDDEEEQECARHSLEMHTLVSDVVGAVLATHGPRFMPVYQEQWHAVVLELAQPHCLAEDRTVAMSLVCDVVLHGLEAGDAAGAAALFSDVLGAVIDCCATGQSSELRRMAAYTVGIAAERFPHCFGPYLSTGLASLSKCINVGDEGAGERGNASDNAVSSVGLLLQACDPLLAPAGLDAASLWGQWLGYLPLRHDVGEGRKVARQLCGLLATRHGPLFCSSDRVTQAATVLLTVSGDEQLASPALSRDVLATLQGLAAAQDEQQWQQLKASLQPDLAVRLAEIR